MPNFPQIEAFFRPVAVEEGGALCHCYGEQYVHAAARVDEFSLLVSVIARGSTTAKMLFFMSGKR
jgi:hypothetical protein